MPFPAGLTFWASAERRHLRHAPTSLALGSLSSTRARYLVGPTATLSSGGSPSDRLKIRVRRTVGVPPEIEARRLTCSWRAIRGLHRLESARSQSKSTQVPRFYILPTLLVHEWHTANKEPDEILLGYYEAVTTTCNPRSRNVRSSCAQHLAISSMVIERFQSSAAVCARSLIARQASMLWRCSLCSSSGGTLVTGRVDEGLAAAFIIPKSPA